MPPLGAASSLLDLVPFQIVSHCEDRFGEPDDPFLNRFVQLQVFYRSVSDHTIVWCNFRVRVRPSWCWTELLDVLRTFEPEKFGDSVIPTGGVPAVHDQSMTRHERSVR